MSWRRWLPVAVLALLAVGCASTADTYVRNHPGLDPSVRQALLAGQLAEGMTPEEVRVSWGAPAHEETRFVPGGRQETVWRWGELIYNRDAGGRPVPGSQRVIANRSAIFRDGRLAGWTDSR